MPGFGYAASMETGIELIAAERRRQIEQKGWTPEHDDEHHKSDELLRAASAYICASCKYPTAVGVSWPWDWGWWKPSSDPIRNLEKAGALIAAEIDRLKREKRQQQ